MKERLTIPSPVKRRRYDFDKLRPGASWHVQTNEERVRILSSFNYWAKNIKKVSAKATSLKVDATDPDGPGFRIWFVSTRPQPLPVQTPPTVDGDDDTI